MTGKRGSEPHGRRDQFPVSAAALKPATSPSTLRQWPQRAVLIAWALLVGCFTFLGALRCWGWFFHASRYRDPRLMNLQRRSKDLINVAAALGIVVTPATTLTELVAALEARTHLFLGEHLRAHLAARFGHGPLPDPWPLAAIARAGKAH